MDAKCYSHLLSTPFQNEGVTGCKENYCAIGGISYFKRELEKRLCTEHLLNCLLIFRILKYLQMTILQWSETNCWLSYFRSREWISGADFFVTWEMTGIMSYLFIFHFIYCWAYQWFLFLFLFLFPI